MKKYLITILLAVFILVSFAFSGCINKNVDIIESDTEGLVPEEETVPQAEGSSAESTQARTPVVMSITPDEAYRIISEGIDHFLLDVRTKEEYDQGHIEGAYLIPVQELESRLDEIPTGKQIIVYCRSGNRSRTAASILIENGFGMVYDMGGISDWQAKGYPVVMGEDAGTSFDEITVDEAYKIFTGDKGFLFIDVRSEEEYNSGHIEGAINIPVSEIEVNLSGIPADKMIIVYCNGSSCNRSSTAAGILIENGFTQVYNLIGNGILEWVEKGYPVVESQ